MQLSTSLLLILSACEEHCFLMLKQKIAACPKRYFGLAVIPLMLPIRAAT